MDPVIVLASNNAGKLTELRAILTAAIPTLAAEQIVDAKTVDAPDVVEDGVTFEANALKKATLTAQATGLLAVADDSGLAVDVMHGAPGIFSADRKSTRLNSSHVAISYAVFCLKKKIDEKSRYIKALEARYRLEDCLLAIAMKILTLSILRELPCERYILIGSKCGIVGRRLICL